MVQRKPAARKAASGDVAAQLIQAKTPRAKRGIKAGLRPNETRVTCVMSDAQSAVLHDWARTNGRTFREISMAMADRYIAEVIQPYAEAGHKLTRRAGVEPPEEYADLYEAKGNDDLFADFDKFAR